MNTYPSSNPDKQRNLKADRDAADKAQGELDGRVRLLRRDLHDIGYTVNQFIASLDHAACKADVVENPLLSRLAMNIEDCIFSINELMVGSHHPIDDPAPEPPPKQKGKGKGKNTTDGHK